ncbi:XRE family transcriptional regulator [Romboutsia ilealis]|uniref:Helix-turn-helix transcriptional regulator n=1 Tax=Romboutsia faecis TaxID=2764597 RepID=A0ABR7JKS7_9FIRM|nr:helix-turn-helix transcriptional regulator [Romboutsia faecis]MBC5995531.1 helix-turn-helix transcriptional regulator [Romboutsia faecis]MRN23731.1 XRE family transcriptional regulator [Romboutsia ilealis]
MKNITFGQLLDKLLYLSNQKKSTLAKILGYDVSYISKWINGKNLPTQKSISDVCKRTSEFIVNSLTPITMQDLKGYFEIDDDVDTNSILSKYLEENLKESYIFTAQKNIPNIHSRTHWEDNYNSMMHINPRLRKQYLSKDMYSFLNKSNKLDLIISANLYRLNNSDRMAISDMKDQLAELEDNVKVRARLLMGFEGEHEDVIFNTILIINMITKYPDMDFKVYNCEVDSNSIMAVVKDSIFHMAIFNKDKQCLLTNMSKEKRIIDEMYYSLDEMVKNQGKPIIDRKTSIEMIRDKKFTQYIMNQDLRLLLGSISELFMPYDLFNEVASLVFGDDDEVLDELKKINMFLQNVTYTSKLKVLIYESGLESYISSGKLNFFNIPVELTFEQREKHINHIEKIITESENVEIKLIDGNFVEGFKEDENPSLYLSKTLKIMKINPQSRINDYAIIRDSEFKNICDIFFDSIWENEIVVDDKYDVLERMKKYLAYSKIINESL